MKKLLACLTLPAVLCAAALAQAQQKPSLKTEEEKTLYALGVALAQSLSSFNLNPGEIPFLTMGLRDSLQRKPLQVDVDAYRPKLEALAQARQAAQAAGEKKKSKAFMDQAAKEPGSEKTASGLIYKVLKEGSGPSPKDTDKVKVHYQGTLPDGRVFDSSLQRGQPVSFPLNGVIPCWTEGVLKMKVGGKSRLICPSSIAYGDRGAPPVIPGGATLVFEVELLDIVKDQAPASGAKP